MGTNNYSEGGGEEPWGRCYGSIGRETESTEVKHLQMHVVETNWVVTAGDGGGERIISCTYAIACIDWRVMDMIEEF